MLKLLQSFLHKRFWETHQNLKLDFLILILHHQNSFHCIQIGCNTFNIIGMTNPFDYDINDLLLEVKIIVAQFPNDFANGINWLFLINSFLVESILLKTQYSLLTQGICLLLVSLIYTVKAYHVLTQQFEIYCFSNHVSNSIDDKSKVCIWILITNIDFILEHADRGVLLAKEEISEVSHCIYVKEKSQLRCTSDHKVIPKLNKSVK